ncbi:MAG: hypothetical protein KAR40_04885 [Candidatus Sabulitectum sp.]|nr:hypothetical protein [Candidatus Sabulitectum sp.]
MLLFPAPGSRGKQHWHEWLPKKKKSRLLEDPDVRRLAAEDPRGFFEDCLSVAVIDEAQRVPEPWNIPYWPFKGTMPGSA